MLEILPFHSLPLSVAAYWPADVPLLCLAGRGRFGMIVTAATEVEEAQALGKPLWGRDVLTPADANKWPFLSGIVGLVSYDRFAAGEPKGSRGESPCRFFAVAGVLLFDQEAGEIAWSQQEIAQNLAAKKGGLSFYLSKAEIVSILAQAAEHSSPHSVRSLELLPQEADGDYLKKVHEALLDIRSGRYYQINLLRYFSLSSSPSRIDLLRRLTHKGGPHAAYFEWPSFRLASFSPERFIEIRRDDQGLKAVTCPIKGTAARRESPGDLPSEDEKIGWQLSQSPKDRAELHMIVDLMRNDLNKVSEIGSVQVVEAHQLVTHPTVHHLQARIESRLKSDLNLGQFLEAVCPAGSITGAPKVEVMQAILAFEGRRRGYFMGHIFFLDDRGRFDSSILIRTLIRREEQMDEFAAGSGLVIKSDPETERLEIIAKCRVLA